MATETTLVNPLREGLRLQRTPEPCVMVIFGASGDLTRRKLVPALYNLTRERLLAPNFAVVGVARRPIGTENFREQMKSGINAFSRVRPVQENVWESFSQGIYYHQTEFQRRRRVRAAPRTTRRDGSRARHSGQPRLLPRYRALELRRDRA